MEYTKKIASALITIKKESSQISVLNNIFSEFADEIIARQGLSVPERHFNIMTIVLEADIDQINDFSERIRQLDEICLKLTILKSCRHAI